MNDDTITSPRISVQVTPEVQQRLRNLIPWGLQSHIFRTIVEGLLDLLEKSPVHQDIIIAAFLSKDITILDLARRMCKDESSRSKTEHQGDELRTTFESPSGSATESQNK